MMVGKEGMMEIQSVEQQIIVQNMSQDNFRTQNVKLGSIYDGKNVVIAEDLEKPFLVGNQSIESKFPLSNQTPNFQTAQKMPLKITKININKQMSIKLTGSRKSSKSLINSTQKLESDLQSYPRNQLEYTPGLTMTMEKNQVDHKISETYIETAQKEYKIQDCPKKILKSLSLNRRVQLNTIQSSSINKDIIDANKKSNLKLASKKTNSLKFIADPVLQFSSVNLRSKYQMNSPESNLQKEVEDTFNVDQGSSIRVYPQFQVLKNQKKKLSNGLEYSHKRNEQDYQKVLGQIKEQSSFIQSSVMSKKSSFIVEQPDKKNQFKFVTKLDQKEKWTKFKFLLNENNEIPKKTSESELPGCEKS